MELLGLKWTDLDWARRTLKIERQLLRPAGDGIQFSAPKTRYGRRTIALGGKTIEVLRRHDERQQAERNTAGEKWQETGLIFTNSMGGPIHPRNLLRNFKQLLLAAGLPPIRFHDLRHTAASIMLNNGIPVITVSRRLGHARASITLDVYGHLIPSLQAEVAEKIDELITPIELHTTAHDLDTNSVKKTPAPIYSQLNRKTAIYSGFQVGGTGLGCTLLNGINYLFDLGNVHNSRKIDQRYPYTGKS